MPSVREITLSQYSSWRQKETATRSKVTVSSIRYYILALTISTGIALAAAFFTDHGRLAALGTQVANPHGLKLKSGLHLFFDLMAYRTAVAIAVFLFFDHWQRTSLLT